MISKRLQVQVPSLRTRQIRSKAAFGSRVEPLGTATSRTKVISSSQPPGPGPGVGVTVGVAAGVAVRVGVGGMRLASSTSRPSRPPSTWNCGGSSGWNSRRARSNHCVMRSRPSLPTSGAASEIGSPKRARLSSMLKPGRPSNSMP